MKTKQTSFSGGEISPSWYARNDIDKYRTFVRQMYNMYPHLNGGASNRPGMKYIAEVASSSKKGRLVPFEYSEDIAYVLLFEDKTIRFFKARGQVTNLAGVITEVVTTYAEADIPYLNFAQSYDTLYITHPSYPLAKLVRTNDYTWTLSDILVGQSIKFPENYATSNAEANYVANGAFFPTIVAVDSKGKEGPAFYYRTGAATWDDNSLDWDGGCSVIDAEANITWDAVSGAVAYRVYLYRHPGGGSFFSGDFGYLTTVYTNAVTIPANARDLMDLSRVPRDVFASPQDITFYGASEYPAVCALFEQRLMLFRSDNEPLVFWGSRTGDLENFESSSPIVSSDGINYEISSSKANKILYAIPIDGVLLVGTTGSEHSVSGGAEALSPISVSVGELSRWGSSYITPEVKGKTILLVDKSQEKLRDLTYSDESKGYVGDDLTVFADHLFKGYKITGLAIQRDPDPIVWVVRDDGTLLSMTYYKEYGIWGWARHVTDGKVESVAVISHTDGKEDVYFIVNRTIGGSTVRYVEYLTRRLEKDDLYETNVKDAFFVDSGLSLDSPVTITDISIAVLTGKITVTAASHGFSDDDRVDLDVIKGTTELNGRRFLVSDKTTHTFILTDLDGGYIDGSDYTTYISGGEVRKCYQNVSGLDHLIGETVNILADGKVVEGVTVAAGGTAAIGFYASRVHVGLPFTSYLETLDYEVETQQGGIQDTTKTIYEVLLRLKDTRYIEIGPDEDTLREVEFRNDENYDDPIDLFTGDIETPIDSGEYREGRLFIKNDKPVPITINGIFLKMDIGDIDD